MEEGLVLGKVCDGGVRKGALMRFPRLSPFTLGLTVGPRTGIVHGTLPLVVKLEALGSEAAMRV